MAMFMSSLMSKVAGSKSIEGGIGFKPRGWVVSGESAYLHLHWEDLYKVGLLRRMGSGVAFCG